MRLVQTTIITTAILTLSLVAWAGNDRVQIIGEHLYGNVLETPHPYAGSKDGKPALVWVDSFSYPDAKYIVFEFSTFDLAPGDWVEVRDPEGRQVHRYEGKGFLNKGGDFISKMVVGSSAEIYLWSTNADPEAYGYRIERISRGYSNQEIAELYGGPEAICGTDDKKDAICYESSFPDVYEESRAAARIVMDGSALCTAWLASCENHVITNNHCTWDDSDFDTQGELDRMEFQFMYQDATCGGGGATVEYSFMGGTWLENDRNLDYTLIKAPIAEDPASTYGWLNIDYRLVDLEEFIYILGHPSGRPKEISLESTHASDSTGFCEVYSQDEPPCVGGSVPEIGYMCDTEGGNSGSPVLSRDTHKVVALHHCANCPNRGVRIQDIWDMNQAGAHPLPPCSLFDDVGSVELDREAHSCSDTIGITVNDGSLQGEGSATITIWSDSEVTPETLMLAETPADSGTFFGSISTTVAVAANGDNQLSVANGDTVTVQYVDEDDGQGGSNLPRLDTSTVDCVPPVIDSVQATNITGMSVDILWNTNEPASSTVTYDTASPPVANSATDTTLVTSHDLRVVGLTECTEYLFDVSSIDLAGNAANDDNSSNHYLFKTGKNTMPTYDATGGPVAIPDNSSTGAGWVISVPDDKTVLDVDVSLDITHSYTGDIQVSLIGPDATQVILSNRRGGGGDNFVSTLFDDEAATAIADGSAPFTGSFIPDESLAAFDGQVATGNWTLFVEDMASGDIGTIDGWSLTLTFPAEICPESAGWIALGSDSYGCGSTMTFTMQDVDLLGEGSHVVQVFSGTESAPEDVSLTEDPPSSGIFVGVFPTTDSPALPGDNALSVANGDTITAEYTDANDGAGGTGVVNQDTASVDCIGPIISNVAAGEIGSSTARITWDTDESADSKVVFDTVRPPMTNVVDDFDLVTAHDLTISGLNACTYYYYSVESADSGGETTIDNNGGSFFSLLTAGGTPFVFDSTNTPVAIPDNTPAGVDSAISVSSSYLVSNVKVLLNITHTFTGDLDISLESPNGTIIDLTSDNGGSGDNFVGTLFDDDALTSITSGTAPFTGSFQPEQPLAGFVATAAGGDWVLHVVDDAGSDTGTLDSWQLQLVIDEPCIPGNPIFLDGFDSGNTSAWGLTIP